MIAQEARLADARQAASAAASGSADAAARREHAAALAQAQASEEAAAAEQLRAELAAQRDRAEVRFVWGMSWIQDRDPFAWVLEVRPRSASDSS